MTNDAYSKMVELISASAGQGILKKAVLSKPEDKANVKCTLTLRLVGGKTVQQDGVYWLETADGKRLRAQRDAIFVKTTGKWYNR